MLPNDWDAVLGDALHTPGWSELTEFVDQERKAGPVYPAAEKVFRAFELLPDLAQRWWELPLRDREGETVRLPLSVVRVLAQDDNAHLGVLGQLERTEHILGRRIDRPCLALLVDELGELRPTGGVQGIA